MPTYEYACSSCGNAWEEIQKITAPPVEVCPACQKATAKRQISGGSFILKGGGWYSDLYASTPKKAGDSKSGDGGAAASNGEAKTETKTESAPKTSEPKKDSGSSSGSSSSTSGSSGSSGSTKAAE